MGSHISLCLLISIFLTVNAMDAVENPTSAAQPAGGILLNGTNIIEAPEISFSIPGLNWTYPYSFYPIYSEGQKISGSFLGTSLQAGANVRLCISDFNLSRFLNASAANVANGTCNMQPIKLNGTGARNFSLKEELHGTYTLFATDEPNSTILSFMPLIVTAQEISVNSSAKVPAGGALKVAIKMQRSDNLTKYYGAVMVSRKDYDGMKLNISSNGSQRNLSSTISFGNRSMSIRGLPSISTDLLMKLFSMLPQDSAVAMQESSKPEAEFYLITDSGWKHGSYLLTCIVYSSGKGILGMRQTSIEVD